MRILTSDWLDAPRTLDGDRLAVAVGDVHGMADHLSALLTPVRDILDAHVGPKSLVYLGDYIDRGPESEEALQIVAGEAGGRGCEHVRLMGNHDYWLAMLLRGEMTEPDSEVWALNGGLMTLKAFGMTTADFGRPLSEVAARVREALGRDAARMVTELRLSHRIGPYLFVHAGIDPARPFRPDDADTLLWIREPFLTPPYWVHDGMTVVHGHTPGATEAAGHRIGVDTGCFKTGVLTAAVLQGASMRYVCAVSDDADLRALPRPLRS